MTFSLVIPTFNRAADLRLTLDSLATLSVQAPWEVIVVDNNSTDDTRSVVERAAADFPTELIYHFEGTQGRSAALNAGIRRSRGDIIVTTDDDVRVPVDWLERAGEALDALQCDYVGGRVLHDDVTRAGGTLATIDADGTFTLTATGRHTVCRLVEAPQVDILKGCAVVDLPAKGRLQLAVGEAGLRATLDD